MGVWGGEGGGAGGCEDKKTTQINANKVSRVRVRKRGAIVWKSLGAPGIEGDASVRVRVAIGG